MRRSRYRKKLNKEIKKIIIGGGAALVLAGLLFFFLYYKVNSVEVMGSSHYSDEEIKEMVLKGPMASNSVLAPLLCSKENVENVPFVDAMQVSQVNRDTICISVKEKQPVGCVPYLDCYMYFDRTGLVIESSAERDMKVPYFDGLELSHVALDKKLPITNESLLNTAVSLARIFEKTDEIPDHIYFDENHNITLEYGTLKAQLGKDKYLEDKMSRLLAALPQLKGKKGIIHMESVTVGNKDFTFAEEVPEEKKESQNEEGEEADSGQDGSFDEGDSGTGENQEDTVDGDSQESDDSGYEENQDGYDSGSTEDGSTDEYDSGSGTEDGSTDEYGSEGGTEDGSTDEYSSDSGDESGSDSGGDEEDGQEYGSYAE